MDYLKNIKLGDGQVEGAKGEVVVILHLVPLCNIHGQQNPEDATDHGQGFL